MKSQTIHNNELTLRPFFGLANQTTHNLTSAASTSTDATTYDHKEITMKTQTTKPNAGTIATWLKNTNALRSLAYVLFVLLAAVSYSNAQPGGTWIALNTQFPGGSPQQALLLTDGSVLVQSWSSLTDWYKLTPDSSGSYIKGTWKQVASIPASFKYAPFGAVTAVLKDGRVAVIGAEDNFSPPYYTSVGAIYNPWNDSWTQVVPPDFGDTCGPDGSPNGGTYWCGIGEAGSVVLNDGSLMVGDSAYTSSGNLSKLEALLPPPYRTGSWIQTGAGKNDGNTEQGYTLLPSLDPELSVVMTVDTYHGFGRYGTLPTPICAGVPAGSPGWHSSEIYYYGQIGPYPPFGQWYCLGDTQVQLWAADDSGPPGTRLSYDEMGPAVLRPDDTVIQFGANVNSATAILGTNLTWTQGPTIPPDINNCTTSNCPPLTLEDGPAALLPDGNVLMMASPGRDTTPVAFFELTFGTNTLVQVPGPSMSYDNSLASSYAQMLELPDGSIMLIPNRGWNTIIEIYQPTDQTYDLSWAPEICGGSCPSGNPTQIYNNAPNQISGLRFNGMSQGAAFGDEFQDATNYPLVRITDSNNEIYYCQTYDFSSMGVQTGDLAVATLYSCPNVPTGTTGNLEVVANGIPSNSMLVTVVHSECAGDVISITCISEAD